MRQQIKKVNNRKIEPLQQADPILDEQAVYRLLGLARRAGRVIGGMDAVEKAIRQHQARLVIVACDAAERTGRQIKETARREHIRVVEFGQKQEIGHWTGSSSRAVVAIMDTHFAVRLNDLIEQTPAESAEEKALSATQEG
ncbi:MAG: ribosomal L7Ae/L30e/S12e/Gadd45 family protein [Clostridia bacterium]|nr:ribosomal L7Ae/L30e/S12e/Gadd45 family protein [Clostridia bacterium]